MRRVVFCLVFAFLLLPFGANAAFDLSAFRVAARSAVLMDQTTGQVMFQQDPEVQIGPASFSKLMTLYLVFEAVKAGQVGLYDQVPISEKAWRTGGSKMFVRVGTRVMLEDLVKGITVVSGNDACVAVAEYVMGDTSAFVNLMNEKAKELGLKHSRFASVHGLPVEGEQYTCALDMARLARSYISRFPGALKYHSMKSFTYSKITQRNRNGLLWLDAGVDGLKTGHLEDAGYHLLATAKNGPRRLISVVMGTKGFAARENEALRLLNYGFRNFTNLELFEEGRVLGKVRVYKGKATELEAAAAQPGLVTVPTRVKDNLTWETRLPRRVIAPVAKGQPLGVVEVRAGDSVVTKIQLVAISDVAEAGLLVRMIHSLTLAFAENRIVALGVLVVGFTLGLAVMVTIVRRKKKVKKE